MAKRKATVSRNPDEVKFVHAPFYNMSNVRKDALSLIVRSSSDPAKVEAIAETLEVLAGVLKLRAKHAAKVRAADIAAAEKAAYEATEEAARHELRTAERGIEDAEAELAKWSELKARLVGEPDVDDV